MDYITCGSKLTAATGEALQDIQQLAWDKCRVRTYLCQMIDTMYLEQHSINRFSSSILFSCIHDNTLRGIMNDGVRECEDRIHCVYLDFTLNGSLELLGNFTYFLGFCFGNWNAADFSGAIPEISPISACLWPYFF